MNGPLRNDQGKLSGAKGILLSAALLALAWLAADLGRGRPLNECHTALFGFLLAAGLVNRISARGRFRLRLGRDGAEVEASEHHNED